MRIAYASLLIATFVATSCTSHLKIEGTIKDMTDGMLYLEALDTMEYRMKIVDSTRISDGYFNFSFDKSQLSNELVLINVPHENVVVSVFLSNGNVYINGDMEHIANVAIKGSKWNDQFKSFYRNVPEKATRTSLENEIKSMYGVKDEDRRSELVREYRNVIFEQNSYIKGYISENTNNPVGACLLLKNLDLFTFDEADTLAEHMSREMADDKYVKVLVKIVNNKRAENEARKHIEVGKKAPDFNLPDADGNMVSLQQLRGKYVLLNFWASNCEACRDNNSTINETYNKFSSCQLTIVGVSVDRRAEDWLKALVEDKLSGVQLIDSTNNVGRTYMVLNQKLPCNILIDSDGYIVSKDIKSQSIFAEIMQAMNINNQ